MKKFLFAALVLFMAVSCSKATNNTSWTKSIQGNMVTANTQTGSAYTDNALVTVEMVDITKPYVNLNIEGVKFVPMMPDVNFFLADIPFKLYPSNDVNDPLYGSWVFELPSIVPTVGGVAREEYTMLNLKGSITDNGIVMEFDVNFGGVIYHATFGKNEDVKSWEATFNATATVVINPGSESQSSTDEIVLSFKQANLSKQIVDITVSGLKFAAAMPEINLELTDVPFALSEDGTQRLFNVATVVPQVDGQKMEQYTITNLTGTVANNSVMLDCDIAAINSHMSLIGTSK